MAQYMIAVPRRSLEIFNLEALPKFREYAESLKVKSTHTPIKKVYHTVRQSTVCKPFNTEGIFLKGKTDLEHVLGENYFVFHISVAMHLRLSVSKDEKLILFFEHAKLLKQDRNGFVFVENKFFQK